VCVCKESPLNPLRILSSVSVPCAQQWCVNSSDENEKQASGASVVKWRTSLKMHKEEKSANFGSIFHELLAF